MLTREALRALGALVKDETISAEARGEELRSVLETAVIPSELKTEVMALLNPLVAMEAPRPLRRAALPVLMHIGDLDAAISVMCITGDGELRLLALGELDMTFGERSVIIMMHYLSVCAKMGFALEFDHVDQILRVINGHRESATYREIVESDDGKSTLQFFFEKHPGALKARFESPSLFNISASKIYNDVMNLFARAPKP